MVIIAAIQKQKDEEALVTDAVVVEDEAEVVTDTEIVETEDKE